jgi:hypothetical protein
MGDIMPTPTPAKYTVQIGPTYTVETAAELTAWAATQRRSVAEVTRQATEAGLALLRAGWIVEHGPLTSEVLAVASADVTARGDRQAARKRRGANPTTANV